MVYLECNKLLITEALYSAIEEHKREMIEANPECKEEYENTSLDVFLADLLFKFGHRLYEEIEV